MLCAGKCAETNAGEQPVCTSSLLQQSYGFFRIYVRTWCSLSSSCRSMSQTSSLPPAPGYLCRQATMTVVRHKGETWPLCLNRHASHTHNVWCSRPPLVKALMINQKGTDVNISSAIDQVDKPQSQVAALLSAGGGTPSLLQVD